MPSLPHRIAHMCEVWRMREASRTYKIHHYMGLMRGYSIFWRKLSIYTPRPALQQRQQALAAMCTPMVPCSRPVTSHLRPAPTSA